MTETPRLSAHSLREYDRCPRAFALQYKAGRFWPAPDPIPSRHQALGQLFHQLIHQRQLGLDIERQLAAGIQELPELKELWERFLAYPHAEQSTFSEQTLNFRLGGVAFSVRFDRLLQQGEDWLILDWKTGKVDSARMKRDWQTKLYPFALAEAGQALNGGKAIPPSRIRLLYWEGATGRDHAFPYDERMHESLRGEFEEKAKQILLPFEENEKNQEKDHFPRTLTRCRECRFDSLCHQGEGQNEQKEQEELPIPRFTLRK